MQQWNAHNSVGANDAAASDENAQWTAVNRQTARQAESYAPCGCSPERVNYLVGLLIDGAENGALNSTELQDVRAELATCELCYQRLEPLLQRGGGKRRNRSAAESARAHHSVYSNRADHDGPYESAHHRRWL